MIIALDWDKTFTECPILWKQFIRNCSAYNIQIIIVTGRNGNEHDRIEAPYQIPVVYSGNEWKHHAALKAGYKVDIWIDDMPSMIMPQGKLDL